MTPMVGDHVRFTPGQGEEDGWLEEILPRRSMMERPSVANVDMLMLVIASVPQPDMLLCDKLILRAEKGGMIPAICVNKIDLGDDLPDEDFGDESFEDDLDEEDKDDLDEDGED